MSDTPPLIDPRNAASLREEVTAQLRLNVPEWAPADPATGQPDAASAALIGVFARLGEIVIQRLNQVPDKNLLAFLDLLGVARLPAQPARVPLTFTLASGSLSGGVVPAGTQAAAPPAEGEKDPVIFETERELTVVAATLQTLLTVDAERDLVADHSSLLAAPAAVGVRVFSGDRANEHVLYIGHRDLLAYQKIAMLQLDFELHEIRHEDELELEPNQLLWEAWDGTSWVALQQEDVTHGLRLNGYVRFPDPPQTPVRTIGGISSRWLRVRLLTPVSPSSTPVVGMARAALLPLLRGIRVSALLERFGRSLDAAFTNAQPVDVTRPFPPFGERPKLGDVFYLGSREAFGLPGASINLQFELINPATGAETPPSLAPTQASADLVLRWEAWTGSQWALLSDSTPTDPGSGGFQDLTRALTQGHQGVVSFRLPDTLAPLALNGVTSHWIRVQIAAGNYGVDARYVREGGDAGGFRLEPATFAAPVLRSFSLAYQMQTAPAPADAVACNNFEFEDIGTALAQGIPASPFRGLPDQPPALYAAFAMPIARQAFPTRVVSLYHGLKSLEYGEHLTPMHPDASIQAAAPGTDAIHRYVLTNAGSETATYELAALGGAWPRAVSPSQKTLLPGRSTPVTVTVAVPPALAEGKASDAGFLRLRASTDSKICSVRFETRADTVAARRRNVRWDYWNGSVWATLAVADATDGLTHPGVVEFLGPADLAPSSRFGVTGYWVRALFDPGEATVEPRLQALLPNTTLATQTVTRRNELLGSSDATGNQAFRTARGPVLASPRLEVRESGPLTDDDLAALHVAHGEPGVTPAGNGRLNEIWVRWIEVPDLYGSGPQDRHYVLDHVTGQVRFGDGVQGRIPPRGAGNIRMARYQTGGGSAGNRAAGTIVQMKTAVPYIEKVFNIESATGGFAAESTAALIARAPRTLRHGGRAVAAEDYEDLARLASPEVARARCVPLRLLQGDPLGSNRVPGAVSVIVVPGRTDAKPLPSVELLGRVEEFLRARQAATAAVAAVGPLYVRVDIAVEVALARLEDASQVEQAIRVQLDAFLHPLTGGRDGTGWDFGREPHLSDLHAVVGGVSDVDHVRQLSLEQVEELEGAKATGRFLVYSGRHQIKLVFDRPE